MLSPGASAEQAHVDALVHQAETLARSEPDNEVTVRAAEEAAVAAELLVADSTDLADRLRLLRARRSLTAARLTTTDYRSAVQAAESCWALCLDLLAETEGSEDFDEVAWLAVAAVVPIIGACRYRNDGEEVVRDVLETARNAADRATGPHGRRARARLALWSLAHAADFHEFHVREVGPLSPFQVSTSRNHARRTVQALRDFAADGPDHTLDLVRALLYLGRLARLAGNVPDAVTAVDEAMTLITPIANEGPDFVEVAAMVRTERERLPDTGPPDLPSERAFQRAFAALGDRTDRSLPVDLPAASAFVATFQPHDPQRGLAKAWHAVLLVADGQPAEAQAVAAAAVRQFGYFTDDPVRVHAALVVALRVLAAAGRQTADRAMVRGAEARSAVLREQLGDRDPALLADLLE